MNTYIVEYNGTKIEEIPLDRLTVQLQMQGLIVLLPHEQQEDMGDTHTVIKRGGDNISPLAECKKSHAIQFGEILQIDYTDKDCDGNWLPEGYMRKMNTDEIYTIEDIYKNVECFLTKPMG